MSRIIYFRIITQLLCLTSIIFLSTTNLWSSDSKKISNVKNHISIDENGKRIIWAKHRTQHIKIDGKLDESAWESATFQGDFLQREPDEGQPATERTEIGLLYDQQKLYFGIKCFDSGPEKIIAREMRRDALVDDDDYFEMILDTYHDKRSGYYFITNAHGSKREAQLANEGRDYNPDWDGVWWCKSQVTDEGWFLEIAIPWKTLRFAEKDSSVWGINFARKIRRKNEHVYWQLIPRYLGGAGLFRLSEAGTLHGLSDLKMSGNFELRPYFLGGLENDLNTGFKTDRLSDLGLDSKISLTANLALDLTVNTDFAQVEADQEQVNLTRFSLYYPEKREFFLEGAQVFSFGGGSGFRWRHRGGTDMSLFYTRRIGLVDGHEARMLGGAKMVGKIGKYRIGMMNILTDEVTYVNDESETVTKNSTNFSVLRLSRDILRRGNIGMMALNKQEIHSSQYNRSLGIDGLLPLSNYFTVSGYLAGTSGPEQVEDGQRINMNKQNFAGKLGLDYNSDLWQFSTSYQDIGARFNPEMGFNRRTDYRLSKASLEYSPRPKNSKTIRQFNYQVEGSYRSDHENFMLDNEIEASFSIEFQNSARFNFDVNRNKEFIDYDWEVRDGFLIPKGTYTGFDYSMRMESDKGKAIAGEINVSHGDYYTGQNTRFGVSGTVTRLQPIRIEIDYSHNYVDLREGDFFTNTLGLRTFYFFSTELYLKAYVQWNDDKLRYEGRERVISNVLLRWIYSPASNLYLVYNDGRLFGPGGTEISNRTFMLKASFFWRK
jgi:hypothetical protein